MNTKESRAELVRANLALVDGKSAREAARLLGVSAQKVIDWREGKIPPMRKDTFSRLTSNLRDGLRDPVTPESLDEELKRYKPKAGEGVDWVPVLLAKVIEAGGSLAMVEAIVAAGRNHTAYMESVAAVQRGVAMEVESGTANGRNAVNKIEVEEAAARRQKTTADAAEKARQDAMRANSKTSRAKTAREEKPGG